MDTFAFDTRGYFMKCAWKKCKLIGISSWKSYLVEFEDGYRADVIEIKEQK